MASSAQPRGVAREGGRRRRRGPRVALLSAAALAWPCCGRQLPTAWCGPTPLAGGAPRPAGAPLGAARVLGAPAASPRCCPRASRRGGGARQGRGARAAVGTDDIPVMLEADDGTAFLGAVLSFLGYVAPLISLGIYTPQAVRLWNRKSAEGLAVSTWVLKLFAVTSTALFTLHLGLPIGAAADVLLLTLQAAVVVALLLAFGSEEQRVTILPALLFYSLWIVAFAQGIIPEEVYSALQSLAAASLTFALVPQIVLNYEKGEAGNFSPLTSTLGVLLCSIRVVTTLSVPAWSPILLATWAGAAVANGVLTAQIIYYNSRAGIDVAETYYSDLRPQPERCTE